MSPTFLDLGVPADLVAALTEHGITHPFPVQTATVPAALGGRDVCGRAPTGSGKTLAFGLPLVARTGRAQPKRPRALVLAPTRELAAQIRRDLEPLAAARHLRLLTVYGGVGYEPQRSALRRGVDVLVACPGRLADLVQQRALRLDAVETVVVDEADRMADMGFLPEVRRLLDQTSPTRQTLLFSATLDGDIAVLTRDYQQDPVRHEVAEPDADVSTVEHHFWRVDPKERLRWTARLVDTVGPTMVFCRTRHGADRVAKQLGSAGVSAAAIHGGRAQGQRDRALAQFTAGHVQALVATDVAARGIHVDAVACVVHFDLPADAKAYVHRSGRTARAGASGSVVSMVGAEQAKAMRGLQRDLGLDVALVQPSPAALSGGARPGREAPRRRARREVATA